MAKVLKCGDLMPGCDTVIVGKDADEVFELYASFLSAPAERLGDFTGPAPGIRSR